MDTTVREVWAGCRHCLNPVHDGPCVLVAHMPGKHNQDSHGGGAGGSGDDDDDNLDDLEPSGPTRLASTQAGGHHMAAFEDADGPAGDRIVAVRGERGGKARWDEDGPYESDVYPASDAVQIADGLRSMGGVARSAPTPDTPDAFDDGPAVLGSGEAGGYRFAALHDGNGDLGVEGQRLVAVTTEKGTAFGWDQFLNHTGELIVLDADDVDGFAAGLEEMAGAALTAALTAAGKSRRIRGLDDERLAAWEDQAETAMAAALAEVMNAVAEQIARAAGVASGRVLWAGCWYCLNPRHPGPCGKPGGPDEGGSHGGGGGPEVLHSDEQAIRDAHDYQDATTGLTAKVTSIRTGGPDSSTYVDVTITDRDGNVVGQATRTIRPPGQKTVQNDGIALRPGIQGQGFATRFNAHSESAYRAHGIERVTTQANIDVGGYSNARAGFDFDSAGSRAGVAGLARSKAGRYPPDVQAEIGRVASNPSASAIEFAMIGHTEGASMWPGKEIMLGSMWGGVKIL